MGKDYVANWRVKCDGKIYNTGDKLPMEVIKKLSGGVDNDVVGTPADVAEPEPAAEAESETKDKAPKPEAKADGKEEAEKKPSIVDKVLGRGKGKKGK